MKMSFDTSGRVALVLIALMIGVGGVEALAYAAGYAAGEAGLRHGVGILLFLWHLVVAGLVLRDTAHRNWHDWRQPHRPDWNPMFPESTAWVLGTFVLPPLFLAAYLIDRPFAPLRPGAPVASPNPRVETVLDFGRNDSNAAMSSNSPPKLLRSA
jgi:hypothetical protein